MIDESSPYEQERSQNEVKADRDRAAKPAHLGSIDHRQNIAQGHRSNVDCAEVDKKVADSWPRRREKSVAMPNVQRNFNHDRQHYELNSEQNRVRDEPRRPVVVGGKPMYRKKNDERLTQHTEKKQGG